GPGQGGREHLRQHGRATQKVPHGQAEAEVGERVVGDGDAGRRARQVDRARTDGARGGDRPRVGDGDRKRADQTVGDSGRLHVDRGEERGDRKGRGEGDGQGGRGARGGRA